MHARFKYHYFVWLFFYNLTVICALPEKELAVKKAQFKTTRQEYFKSIYFYRSWNDFNSSIAKLYQLNNHLHAEHQLYFHGDTATKNKHLNIENEAKASRANITRLRQIYFASCKGKFKKSESYDQSILDANKLVQETVNTYGSMSKKIDDLDKIITYQNKSFMQRNGDAILMGTLITASILISGAIWGTAFWGTNKALNKRLG